MTPKPTMSVRAAALAAMIGVVPTAAWPQEAGSLDRAAVEEIVREYITRNPEIVRDALEEAERRAAVATIAEARSIVRSMPISTSVGPAEPKIVMLEFFDYNCPYCRTVVERIATTMDANPDMTVQFVEFPILSPDSIEAARVALAAAKQNRYFEYHMALMGQTGRIDGDTAMDVAETIGLDMERLSRDLSGEDIDATLRMSREAAELLSVSGTPAFVIGDVVVPGAIGEQGLQQLIERARGEG